MIRQFIEFLCVTLFNWLRRSCSTRKLKQPASVEIEAPPDRVVIGRMIPVPSSASSEPVATQRLHAIQVALTPEARRRHLYILGATGTGKTNLLLQLIESDIKHQRAFCVVDLRGDLVDRILLRLARSGSAQSWRERLLLVDLRDSDHLVGFNPLRTEGDAYNRALSVLEVLKAQSESWGVQLEETLRNSLVALAECGWSLLEIEPLLTNAAFRSQVLAKLSDRHVQGFFERFNELSAANQLSWTLAVLNKVTPLLAVPQLRLMFGQRQSFSFRTLLDQQPGMIILISLAVDRLHQAARLTGGLFVSAFQSAIMSRVDQPESERVPAFLYVDEFETMATDRFESIVAEGRRFGLGLCLSHQNISQLSPGLRHVLRNNVHTQVYFQTGALDAAELAKEISSPESTEDIRATLIGQGVGEAYLVRRGQPSSRIQTHYSPDPKVNSAVVEAIRQVSFTTYARPRSEIEHELLAREQEFKSLTGKAASGEKPAYEIRHGKTTRFTPKPSQPRNPGSNDKEPERPL